MREYPISTLLVWKTKEAVKHRKFIDNYRRDIKLTDFFVPDNRKSKLMVLDGQQRLQSLFIGLKGSYEGRRELYLDILSGANALKASVSALHSVPKTQLNGRGYGSKTSFPSPISLIRK